jgi:hypothetical protein
MEILRTKKWGEVLNMGVQLCAGNFVWEELNIHKQNRLLVNIR